MVEVWNLKNAERIGRLPGNNSSGSPSTSASKRDCHWFGDSNLLFIRAPSVTITIQCIPLLQNGASIRCDRQEKENVDVFHDDQEESECSNSAKGCNLWTVNCDIVFSCERSLYRIRVYCCSRVVGFGGEDID
ncbi:hypothetical protein LINGRAHAP2_LOCUS8875 [Linum grandiflorum]